MDDHLSTISRNLFDKLNLVIKNINVDNINELRCFVDDCPPAIVIPIQPYILRSILILIHKTIPEKCNKSQTR